MTKKTSDPKDATPKLLQLPADWEVTEKPGTTLAIVGVPLCGRCKDDR
jgi:hypothetical protein